MRVIATPKVIDELHASPFEGAPDWFPIDTEPEAVVPVGIETQREYGRDPHFDDLLVDAIPGLEGRVEVDAFKESEENVGVDEIALILELRGIRLQVRRLVSGCAAAGRCLHAATTPEPGEQGLRDPLIFSYE